MALWVLHERCFGAVPDSSSRKEYERDTFLRRLRAENLMKRFLDDSTYPQLAHSLLRTNHLLAGQLGGIAFEQMVRQRVPRAKNWDNRDLEPIIDDLHNDGIIDTATKFRWHRARITRNKAIHLNPPPDPVDVQRLVELLDLSARETAREKSQALAAKNNTAK
jgi:hypothetical protein